MVMFGAQRACNSIIDSSSSSLDQRVHVVSAPRRLRQQGRQVGIGHLSLGGALAGQEGGQRSALLDGVGFVVRDDVHDPRAAPVRVGAAEPQHVDVLAGDRANDVGSGDEDPAFGSQDHNVGERRPVAAPPAAKPSTMEICGTFPEAMVMAWKICPTASKDSTPSSQPGAAGVPDPENRNLIVERPLVGLNDDFAAVHSHRPAHDGGVRSKRRPRGCR